MNCENVFSQFKALLLLIGNVTETVPCTTHHHTFQVQPCAWLGLRGQVDAEMAVIGIGLCRSSS